MDKTLNTLNADLGTETVISLCPKRLLFEDNA